MTEAILDTSALLAVFNGENGADRVEGVLDGACISALVVAELATWAGLRSIPPDVMPRWLAAFDISVEPFTTDRAWSTGHLVGATRKKGLSLTDRACLALAMEMNVPVYTADRVWAEVDIGVDIRLIR